MSDLDNLRPEVRRVLPTLDSMACSAYEISAVKTITAELLRLAGDLNAARLSSETFEAKYQCMRERAERAEAELAALKARIARSALVLCEVPEHAPEDDPDYGFFYMPRSLWNTRVALVKVEE